MKMTKSKSRVFSALLATAVITTGFLGASNVINADTVQSNPVITQAVNAATVMSIADARKAAVNTTVSVKGIVTYINGGQYFIQDGTAGVCVYKKGLAVSVGDEVTATGVRTDYGKAPNVLAEIVPAATTDVVAISHGNTPVIPEVSIANLSDNNQGQFVKIKNVKISSVTAGQSAMLTDEAALKSVSIYKVPAGVTGVSANDYVDVVGMFSQYKDLTVVNGADITKNGAQGPVVENPVSIAAARDAAKGTVVTVTGTVTYINGGQCFIQDNSTSKAGICIYKQGMNVAVGDSIKVTGVRDEYISNGSSLIEVVPGAATAPYVNVISNNNPLPCPEVVISDLKPDYQSMFVKVVNAKLSSVTANTEATLTDIDDAKQLKIYKVPEGVSGVAANDTVAARGLYTQYNDLRVLSASDIVKAE